MSSKMETIDLWFKREVQSWRTAASIGWSLLSLPIIFTVYTVLSHLYFFSPLSCVTGSASAIVSVHFLVLLSIMMVLLLITSVFTISSYTVIPEVSETRLDSLIQLLTPPRPLHGVIYFISGALCTWICCNILGERYNQLSIEVDKSGRYILNEYHMFLMLYGMYCGIMFIVFFYLNQSNYIQFNILQQSRFFQVKGQIFDVLMSSIKCTLRQTLYFYPLYWLFGGIPKDLISQTLSLLRPEWALNSIYGLLDIRLLYQTLLLGWFLHFTWSYTAMLYRVYMAEHFTFPIESAFDSSTKMCLIDAMSCQKESLLKYLGFLDFSHLSKHSLERRLKVFSLSQPGGHPHNWNKLSSVCLSEIDNINQKIQEENWKVYVNVPVRQTEKIAPVTVGDSSSLTHRGAGTDLNANPSGDAATNQPPPKTGILSSLKKKPIFGFFLMDTPDSKSRQLFKGAQIQIWAIEALSSLATASYTEDKFGVVQRSLPTILTSLLNLQENVEKHFKLAASGSRRQIKDCNAKDAGLKYSLQTTLKSSLYKIINTFGEHVMSLKLQPDASRKLKQFIEYRE